MNILSRPLKSEVKVFIISQFVALVLFLLGCYFLKSTSACFLVFIILIGGFFQGFKKLKITEEAFKEKI